MKRALVVISVLVCLLVMVFAATAMAEEKKVGKVEILTEPSKVEYWIDEPFDAEGGVLLVTYKDKTTAEVPMTADGVDFGKVKTNSVGRKSIKVTYGGKNATFYIMVSEKGETVTFNLNYDGAEAIVSAARKDKNINPIADPEREGYAFAGWFEDADCTVAYDFDAVVVKPLELYACWTENGAAYHTVSFDLNYYGVVPASYAQLVKDGETARDLALVPERAEFAFDGWYADADCTVAYAPAAVTADTTVFAKWNAQKSGSSQYVFEAEMTNLIGKEGPGMSGAASGASMIVKDATGLDASNGKFVSYLYKQGLGLEFYLASSDAVTDAVLTLRVAGEMQNINLNAENYLIKVNGEAVDFSSVSLPSGDKFEDAIVVKNVTLVKGANVIELVTNNSVNPMGEGMGTYQGTAPMVDCIKLDTTAVVIWDANHQLPMQY